MMIDQVLRRGSSVIAALVILWIASAPSLASPVCRGPRTLYNRGLRWIGVAPTCTAPPGWIAERLFRDPTLPAALTELCLYTWTAAPASPAEADVDALACVSQELTEDVPVVYPSGFSTPETALFTGLRAALRAQVGDASLLPGVPATPAVRVVVLDTAPDAAANHIQPGLSRHGDTLAHLIEDLVCLPASDRTSGPVVEPSATTRAISPTHPARICAAEVTTVLALPWTEPGVPGSHGGYLGTLADLARAIERAVSTWQADRLDAPTTTPAHLVLNLSIGWEHTAQIADCSTEALPAPPARAVLGILQHAAAQDALIIAAAGNDSGGPSPRTGLVCPGLYQAVPQDATARSLVVAVSAVDYHDHPLETVRPAGTTAIVGLGLGGVAWSPSDPVPPALTGSSVSTAVASAVSALVWTAQPGWAPSAVSDAVYRGGVDLGTQADACPLALGACHAHRVSVCGALYAAGGAPHCAPAAAQPASCPALPAAIAALSASYAVVPQILATPIPDPVQLANLPRYLAPTVQIQPSTFPMPISETCPTCVVQSFSGASTSVLLIPARTQILESPVLVVRLTSGVLHAMSLGDSLAPGLPHRYVLSAGWVVQSAYLTGFDGNNNSSVTEQLFVAP
jgi:Subtilase family